MNPTASIPYLPLSGIVSMCVCLIGIINVAMRNSDAIIAGPARTAYDFVPVFYGKFTLEFTLLKS